MLKEKWTETKEKIMKFHPEAGVSRTQHASYAEKTVGFVEGLDKRLDILMLGGTPEHQDVLSILDSHGKDVIQFVVNELFNGDVVEAEEVYTDYNSLICDIVERCSTHSDIMRGAILHWESQQIEEAG